MLEGERPHWGHLSPEALLQWKCSEEAQLAQPGCFGPGPPCGTTGSHSSQRHPRVWELAPSVWAQPLLNTTLHLWHCEEAPGRGWGFLLQLQQRPPSSTWGEAALRPAPGSAAAPCCSAGTTPLWAARSWSSGWCCRTPRRPPGDSAAAGSLCVQRRRWWGSYRGVQCTQASRSRCIRESHPTGRESRSLGSGIHVPHSPPASRHSLHPHTGSRHDSVWGSGKCSRQHGSHTCLHSGRDWGHTGLSPPGRRILSAQENNNVTWLKPSQISVIPSWMQMAFFNFWSLVNDSLSLFLVQWSCKQYVSLPLFVYYKQSPVTFIHLYSGIMWAGFIMMAREENTGHFLPIHLHMLPTAVLLYIMAPVLFVFFKFWQCFGNSVEHNVPSLIHRSGQPHLKPNCQLLIPVLDAGTDSSTPNYHLCVCWSL